MIVGAHQNKQLIPIGNTGVKLANCWQVELGLRDDIALIGVREATTLRIQSPCYDNGSGIFADLTSPNRFTHGRDGVGGLDVGTRQPNTEYWLWLLSDGVHWGLVWSQSCVFPDLANIGAGYIYGALQMWNRTDANGNLLKMQKVDRYCSFPGVLPLAYVGATPNGGYTPVLLTPLIGPNAAKVDICIQCPDPSAVLGISAEDPIGQQEELQISPNGGGMVMNRTLLMSSGYIYFRSNGPRAALTVTGFEDVF